MKVKVEGKLENPLVIVPELPELLSYGNHNISNFEMQCVAKLQAYFKKVKLSIVSYLVVNDHQFFIEIYSLSKVKKFVIRIYDAQLEKDNDLLSSARSLSHSKISQNELDNPKQLENKPKKLLRVLSAPMFYDEQKYSRFQLRNIAQFIMESKLVYQYGTFIIESYTRDDIDRALGTDMTVNYSQWQAEKFELVDEKLPNSKNFELLQRRIRDPMPLSKPQEESKDAGSEGYLSKRSSDQHSMMIGSVKGSHIFRDLVQNIAQFTLNEFNPVTQYRKGLMHAESDEKSSDSSIRYTIRHTISLKNADYDLDSDEISKIKSDGLIPNFLPSPVMAAMSKGNITYNEVEQPTNILGDYNLKLDLDFRADSDDQNLLDESTQRRTQSASSRKSSKSLRIRHLATSGVRRKHNGPKQTNHSAQIAERESLRSEINESFDKSNKTSMHDCHLSPTMKIMRARSRNELIDLHSRGKLATKIGNLKPSDDSIHDITSSIHMGGPSKDLKYTLSFKNDQHAPKKSDLAPLILLPVDNSRSKSGIEDDNSYHKIIKIKSMQRTDSELNAPLIFMNNAPPLGNVIPRRSPIEEPGLVASINEMPNMKETKQLPQKTYDLIPTSKNMMNISRTNFASFKSIGEVVLPNPGKTGFFKKKTKASELLHF